MDTRNDESEQQPTEMHTLCTPCDDSSTNSRLSECSQEHCAWSDEIIRVPIRYEGNSQGTSMRGVCSRLLSRVCWK